MLHSGFPPWYVILLMCVDLCSFHDFSWAPGFVSLKVFKIVRVQSSFFH